MKIMTSEIERIGNVPLLHLNAALGLEDMADIYVAMLHLNPTGSHKVHSYMAMIRAEEQAGNVVGETNFVDYTTGNAGIAGAFVCAQKGYEFSVFMPKNMSPERVQLLKALGADVHLTPEDEFIVGAKTRAEEFVAVKEKRILLNQSANPNNPKGYEPIGKAMIEALGNIDTYVCGAGTYGTITGVATALKEHDPNIEITCIEAMYAPHLHSQRNGYEDTFTPHNLIGFGAELLAPNANPKIYDRVEIVDEKTATQAMKLMHSRGYLIGKTSGANVHFAIEKAKELGPGKIVVTNTFDGFERILSERVY